MAEVRFYNVWNAETRQRQNELVDVMRSETAIFVDKPGFVSLTAWTSETDNRIIVEATWATRADFEAAVLDNPAADAGRERMGKLASESPAVFTPVFTHLPHEGKGNGHAERPSATSLPGFESQFIDGDGLRLHAVVGGAGPAVLLVHGWPSTWWAWRKVMPQLARGRTVVAVDLRGFGDSTRPDTGYDKQTLADDLHRLVASLGLGSVALVSHDMGGTTAYSYAVTHPEEVRSFAFLESGLPGFGLEAAMDVAHGGGWHFAFNMAPELPELLTAGRERPFLEHFYRRGTVHDDAIGPADVDEFVRGYAAPGGMHAAFEIYRTLLDDGKVNAARPDPMLQMPVLAIDGMHGLNGMSAATMRQVAANPQVAVIEDAGHFLMEDNPAGVLAVLEPFLATTDKTSQQR